MTRSVGLGLFEILKNVLIGVALPVQPSEEGPEGVHPVVHGVGGHGLGFGARFFLKEEDEPYGSSSRRRAPVSWAYPCIPASGRVGPSTRLYHSTVRGDLPSVRLWISKCSMSTGRSMIFLCIRPDCRLPFATTMMLTCLQIGNCLSRQAFGGRTGKDFNAGGRIGSFPVLVLSMTKRKRATPPGGLQARIRLISGFLVGAARFERAAPCTPCRCATWLRYAPTAPRISYPVCCFNFGQPAPVLDSSANRRHNTGAYGAWLGPANLDARIICSRFQNPRTPLGGFSWPDRWTA